MRQIALAATLLAGAVAAAALPTAGPALAGEMVSGTNTVVKDQRIWKTGERAGYWMYSSKGESRPVTGPLPAGPVECHGAGFWDAEHGWGSGICIFGTEGAGYTLVWEMDTRQKFESTEMAGYERRGMWRVATGTGRFVGMTGSGSFVSEDGADGAMTTHWQGTVEMPE